MCDVGSQAALRRQSRAFRPEGPTEPESFWQKHDSSAAVSSLRICCKRPSKRTRAMQASGETCIVANSKPKPVLLSCPSARSFVRSFARSSSENGWLFQAIRPTYILDGALRSSVLRVVHHPHRSKGATGLESRSSGEVQAYRRDSGACIVYTTLSYTSTSLV